MLSESETEGIVRDAAKRLGMGMPRLSFVPAKISFMPVLVLNGGVTVTPAARTALSAEAMDFAVVHGPVSDAQRGERGNVSRRVVPVLGAFTGWFVSLPFQGAARVIVSVLVGVVAIVAYFFGFASIQSKWPSTRIDRRVLQAIHGLEGAREHALITDRYDLNDETPEEWSGPHGKLVNLDRLEKLARRTKLPDA